MMSSSRKGWCDAIQKVSDELDKKQRSQVSKPETRSETSAPSATSTPAILKVRTSLKC